MTANRIRRAAALAAMLSMLVSAVATADTITADGDSVTAGTQVAIDLGTVTAGDTRAVDVGFVLACKGTAHVTAGSTVAVVEAGLTLPGDGTAVVSPGSIDVPATWPAPGESCPDAITIAATTPAHVVLTAPSTPGSNLEFDVMFAPDPDTGGVSNTTFFSAFMDVVEAGPTDDTPPVLTNVPDTITVSTTGTSAVVSWTLPTATDDTDPSPTVSCSPHSGSTFPLGTTTVTCTATDASGNSASATFDVTVVQEVTTVLVGSWGQPLGDAMPALVGQLGRTLPLKLTVTADGVVQGGAAIDPPALAVAPLAACDAGAPAGAERALGAFDWSGSVWQRNLKTDALGPGCWRLTASVDGAVVATAVIQLEGGQVAASLRKH